MQRFNCDGWVLHKDHNLGGVLYLAQRWQEMLFDYTFDSYRVKTFNLLGLCEEITTCVNLCEIGVLRWIRLQSLRDEVLLSIEQDVFAKTLLEKEYDELIKRLRAWVHNQKHPEQLAYISHRIIDSMDGKYFNTASSELIRVSGNPKEKERIDQVCMVVLTELIRKGISPRYLFKSLENQFFSGQNIDSVNSVKDFLDGIPKKQKKYTVIYPSPRSGIVARNANPDFIQHVRNLSPELRKVSEPEFVRRNGGNGLLIFKEVEAFDAFSARSIAEERLAIAGSFVGFFIHELDIYVPKFCAVVGEDGCEIVPRSKKATLRRQDMRLALFDKSFHTMVGPFVNNETDQSTRARLIGAFRAHRSGTHGASEEDQLTNLWTSLETLVGTTPDGNVVSQLNAICIPILCLTYMESVLGDLAQNIMRCVSDNTKEQILLKKDKGEDDRQFWLRFVTSDGLRAERDIVYGEPDDLTLLKYRLFRVRELLVKPALALRQITAHEKRLCWHIERIYRTRNILVHAGQIAGPQLSSLVVNLHSYVDQLITAIVQRLHREKHKVSLEKVFYEFQIDYGAYIARLRTLPDTGEHPEHAIKIAWF